MKKTYISTYIVVLLTLASAGCAAGTEPENSSEAVSASKATSVATNADTFDSSCSDTDREALAEEVDKDGVDLDSCYVEKEASEATAQTKATCRVCVQVNKKRVCTPAFPCP